RMSFLGAARSRPGSALAASACAFSTTVVSLPCHPRCCLTLLGTRRPLGDEVVELPVLDAGEERADLAGRVDQCRTVRRLGVADRDLARVESGDLDAVTVATAVPALVPCKTRQHRRGIDVSTGTHEAFLLRDAVMHLHVQTSVQYLATRVNARAFAACIR